MGIPWGGIASAVGGIAGLFSSKKGAPSARENINKLAQGARQASERYGFNPLTLLGAGSTMGGGGGGGAAPLASIDLIVGGLKDISDEASGDADRRRKAEELELDLAKVKLDQARSGVVIPPIATVASGVGSGPSPLGRRSVIQGGEAGATPRKAASSFGAPTVGQNSVAPGRKQEIDPVINSPGVFEIQNRATAGYAVTIPGEGEPWGLDELATAVVVGVPQIAGRLANQVIYGGKSFSERMKDYAEREKKREKKPQPEKKVYDGPGGPVYDFNPSRSFK